MLHLKIGKLVLFVLFLWAVGVFSFTYNVYSGIRNEGPVRPDQTMEYKAANGMLMSQFMEERIRAAKEMGIYYSPKDFYNGMRISGEEEAKLKVESNNPYLPELHALMRENVDKGFFSHEDITNASKMFSDYLENVSQRTKKKPYDLIAKISNMGWIGILLALWGMYLKVLPVILALYIIWFVEEKNREGKLVLPNPLRFLLSLVFYPVVLPVIFSKKILDKGSYYISEAEYRRTKEKMFSRLSEKETERIKNFVSSGASSSYWREQLSIEGLTIKHSLALALVATFILVLIPKIGQTETKNYLSDFGAKVKIEKSIQQHLPRMGIDNDDNANCWQPDLGIAETVRLVFILGLVLWTHICLALKLKEYCQEIDHVPIYSVIQPIQTN